MTTSKPDPNPVSSVRHQVYSFNMGRAQNEALFHMAVRRDDLHTFVILADIPNGSKGLVCAMLRPELLRQTLRTPVVDWARERVIFGDTSWLSRRSSLKYRAICRLNLSKEGLVTQSGILPMEIAEPLLCMLEDSVPEPDPSNEANLF